MPRPLFWVPNRLNELPEVPFKFPFILFGKHGAYLNPGIQVGAQNKDFGAVMQMKLNQSLVSSVAQASLKEMAEIEASEISTM